MAKIEDYVTVKEFSDLAHVSVQAVYKAMNEKRINYTQLGSVRLVLREEAQKFHGNKK